MILVTATSTVQTTTRRAILLALLSSALQEPVAIQAQARTGLPHIHAEPRQEYAMLQSPALALARPVRATLTGRLHTSAIPPSRLNTHVHLVQNVGRMSVSDTSSSTVQAPVRRVQARHHGLHIPYQTTVPAQRPVRQETLHAIAIPFASHAC